MAGRLLAPRNWYPLLFFIAGIIVAFLTRSSYLHRGYLLDDYGFVAAGPLHFKELPRIFSPSGIDWFYRPVFVVYARAMTNFFGGASLPRHMMSLILFGLNAGVVGLLAAHISGRVSAGWVALALFMTASGMEEAIWWFSSASTLIASLFSFLAVLAWLYWRQSMLKVGRVVAGVCMMIALCSKEDVAALPLMLVVLDWVVAMKIPLRTRLVHFLPLATWACLWLVCDLLAYRHVSSHNPTTRLWQPDVRDRLELAGSFCYRTLALSLIGSSPSFNWPLWITALGVTAAVGWRVRRHVMLSALAICALLSALPVPLASGEHVLSERFAFFPQAWASVLGAVLVMKALHSRNHLTSMTGIAIAGQCLFARFFLPMVDPYLIWAVLVLFAALSFLLAVWVKRLRPAFLIAGIATAAAFVQALLPGMDAVVCWSVVVIAAAVIARRITCWLDGSFCGAALLTCAPWTLPFYLLAPLLPSFYRLVVKPPSISPVD